MPEDRKWCQFQLQNGRQLVCAIKYLSCPMPSSLAVSPPIHPHVSHTTGAEIFSATKSISRAPVAHSVQTKTLVSSFSVLLRASVLAKELSKCGTLLLRHSRALSLSPDVASPRPPRPNHHPPPCVSPLSTRFFWVLIAFPPAPHARIGHSLRAFFHVHVHHPFRPSPTRSDPIPSANRSPPARVNPTACCSRTGPSPREKT